MLDRPLVAGVVNVTPDSFSDGGHFLEAVAAVDLARRLVEEGADIVDVGAESSRPGADVAVPPEEELRRLLPVLKGLRDLPVPVSVDTVKPEVMRAAIAEGASMVNDINALRAPGALEAVASAQVGVCLMHMQGEPRTMQVAPHYDDVVSEVTAFLEERLRLAVDRGVSEERICLDPGIGFGKTPDQNLELIRRLDAIVALGRPVLVGLSRKSTLGKALGDPKARVATDAASVGAAIAAFDRGASIFRAHDVRLHVDALGAARAVEVGLIG